MSTGLHDLPALRQCVLAVSVLNDIDLVPTDEGVLTASGRLLSWPVLADALGGHPPDTPAARPVLAAWLRDLTAISWRSAAELSDLARPVGLPRDHPLHPGPDWVVRAVPGGVLDLGVGLAGVGSDPDQVVLPRPGLLAAAGYEPAVWWPRCEAYLDQMASLAAARLQLNPGKPIRPMGDADVVTLLGSQLFRRALVDCDGVGMRAAAVPTRRRGWLDLSRTDPAFALVAASLAEPDDRGFNRPLLITLDEVVMARDGGDPVLQALRDGAAPDPVLPSVLYR